MTDLSESKRVAWDWVDQHQGMLVDAHMRIWELAEVGLQENRTADLLTSILREKDFNVTRGVAGMPSAFVATYGAGKPVIGMRARGPRLWPQRLRRYRPRRCLSN